MSTAGEHLVKLQTGTHSLSSHGKNDTETNGGGPSGDEAGNPVDRRVVEAGVGNVSTGWNSWLVATDMFLSDGD